jgi:hypothetical protein
MDLFSTRKLPFEWLWAFFIIAAFHSLAYKAILIQPDAFLVPGGDGMKNYYTFLYHVVHGDRFMEFSGMNYPFGENIIFTDNQPLLAETLRTLKNIFPEITCHLTAIHNLTLLLGMILGTLGLFFCLRHRNVPFWFALAASGGLMLLNPQAGRIHGHFAMFYPVLPWIFLFLMEIMDGASKYRNSVWIGAIITVTGLLHMYHFITSAILCCLFLAWMVLAGRQKLKESLAIFSITVLLPFMLLHSLSAYIHPVGDRPADPWGFFSFQAAWEGFVFSYRLPLYEFIHNNITKIEGIDVEGKNYLGLTAVIFILYSIYAMLRQFRKKIAFSISGNADSMLIFVSVFSVLISMGYPFSIPGMEWLLDYSGPFKQFRSVGRVGWISFYAINLLAIPAVFALLRDRLPNVKGRILVLGLGGFMLTEGIVFHTSRPLQQSLNEGYTCQMQTPAEIGTAEKYQAILPDPFFHIGSECFSWWDQAYNCAQSFEWSYRLGMPIVGVNMSRTSYAESFEMNELTCKPYKVPSYIQHIREKDQRPLLVVQSKLDVHESRGKLSQWTANAPVVYETDQYVLKELDLARFDSIVAQFNVENQSIRDTSQVFPLTFTKKKGEKGWGYEAEISDNGLKNAGKGIVEYWLDCPSQRYVHSLTEVWQFDGNHNMLEYTGEANRFNYKEYNGSSLRIEIPVHFREEAVKVVVRISCHLQKSKDELQIEGCRIRI